MVLYIVGTVPFLSTWQRSLHFAKHGHEFGAQNEFDYEARRKRLWLPSCIRICVSVFERLVRLIGAGSTERRDISVFRSMC